MQFYFIYFSVSVSSVQVALSMFGLFRAAAPTCTIDTVFIFIIVYSHDRTISIFIKGK